jgi:hypothetical protein
VMEPTCGGIQRRNDRGNKVESATITRKYD